MKNIYLAFMAAILCIANVHGQKVISNGFPGVGVVNGTNYIRTGTIGTMNNSFVAASSTMGFASNVWDSTLYFIDMANETITDSIKHYVQDMEVRGDTLYAISGAYLLRIRISTKAIIDSVMVSTHPYRLELRPGADEAWLSDSTQVYIVSNLTGSMTVSSFKAGVDQYDNSPIRFTKGGSIAYKAATITHRVYKIDAANKTITDSVDIPGGNNSGVAVSSDSSKMYVSNTNDFKIYVIKTSDMTLMDSINSPREPFEMYTHPTRAEMWCVNHFDDSVTVYKESDNSELAAIDLPPSPHIIAFVYGNTGVNDVAGKIDGVLYPNPGTKQLHVSLPVGGVYSIGLYDNTGKMIQSLHTKQPVTTLQVADLPAGMYHINITNDKGAQQHLQWVKYE
ncbi:MAG: T9SS type A sorting domain-containing protein [Chitinophagaceae bacterium]|nr:T9SS type A sorting domain-containing protein [Chitinophagaceae bacterium]